MIDALKAIKEDIVTLSFGGSMRPILIEAGEQSAAVHLISPVRAYQEQRNVSHYVQAHFMFY